MKSNTDYLFSSLSNDSDGHITFNQAEFYQFQKIYLGDVKPYLANIPEKIFLSLLQSDENGELIQLNLKPNGWKVNAEIGILKFAFVSSVLGGLLLNLGYNQIPTMILPTIIPFLFEIEKCNLSNKEEIVLSELYINPKIKNRNKTFEPNEIYALLPKTTQKQISLLDFTDFLDKFHLSGFLNRNENDSYTFNPKNNPKFRITFK